MHLKERSGGMGSKMAEVEKKASPDEGSTEGEPVLEEEGHKLPGSESHFFMGNKFFYEERDYEKAIQEYKQASEEETDESIRLKAIYLMAESHVKIGKIEDAINIFKTIADGYKEHYLKDSARRRIEKLSEYLTLDRA